jgi:hypothetical protein
MVTRCKVVKFGVCVHSQTTWLNIPDDVELQQGFDILKCHNVLLKAYDSSFETRKNITTHTLKMSAHMKN